MIIINVLVVLMIGVMSGILVAAGIFTLITSLGIVTRLAQITKTAKWLLLYENWICIGATIGTICWFIISENMYLDDRINIAILIDGNYANTLLVCWGLFSGMFTGCLIGAIAEILDAFPIMFRRIRFSDGIAYIVVALALGKFCGVILQFFF